MVEIKIKSIRPLENEPLECVSLELRAGDRCEKKRMILPLGFCAERGITAGAVEPSVYDGLEAQSGLSAAVRRGQVILSYGANSRATLVRKLETRGVSREDAESAADELEERGFIDDEKSVTDEVERCLRKLWGPRRIAAHLRAKGYRDGAMSLAADMLEDADLVGNCRKLIEKRYPEARSADRTARERAFTALMRYGYSQGEIRRALNSKGR